jgi:hypothetical protein
MEGRGGGASGNSSGFDLSLPSGAPEPALMAQRSGVAGSSLAGIAFRSSSVGDASASPP